MLEALGLELYCNTFLRWLCGGGEEVGALGRHVCPDHIALQ